MNKNIDDILNGLQSQQPTLYNEDELTDMIMDNLPDIQLDPIEEKEKPLTESSKNLEQVMGEPQQKPPRILVLVRTISSVAAIWLVGLFAYTYMPETSNENAVAMQRNYEISNNTQLSGTLKVVYSNHFEKKSNSIYGQIKKLSESKF